LNLTRLEYDVRDQA